MTATAMSADAPFGRHKKWESIDWKSVTSAVRRLQVRIAKAVKERKFRKAKAIQWILTHSYYAKLLAIKRVTSNKGKRTPGVDGMIWTTSRQKLEAVGLLKRQGYNPLPLRRIYIPKKDKTKKRPLSIPTIKDRACQALYKLALEPVAETLADPNSYGFRSWRSCTDAIAQCFITLSNMVLDGLEATAIAAVPARIGGYKRSAINVIRYADDFAITGRSRDLLESQVKPAVESFLCERGLTLSEAKTRIVRIVVIPPSIFFILWPSKYLFDKPQVIIGIFIDNIK